MSPYLGRRVREQILGSFSERLSANRQILENAYWVYPADYSDGHHEWVPVGRLAVSSVFCGKWKSFNVCDDVEHHEGVILNGVDFSNRLAVTHNHMWCDKAGCPVCFIRGWAARASKAIEGRLAVASERGFGDVEHLTVSVPPEFYGLSFDEIKEKVRVVLEDRGILGGCTIVHAFRKDDKHQLLHFALHFHVLGFVRGGADVCRHCEHTAEDCHSCSCLRGRLARGYLKDRFIVKIHDKRKTVAGTSFYQLNHSSLKVGLKRFHSVVWFGVCANKKFKGRVAKSEALCPVCKKAGYESLMAVKIYRGTEFIARDVGNPLYRKVLAMPMIDASGVSNFEDLVGGDRDGG